MVQLHTTSPLQPMGHTSFLPGAGYVYDIEHRSGLAMPTLYLYDIDGSLAYPMGKSIRCPVDVGACVAGGGLVKGYDMYGQYVEDDSGTVAFASIVEADPGATWTNQFGLPYRYLAEAATPNADVTITPPDDDAGDARGTFAFAGTLPGEFVVPYMVDQTQTFGKPYSDRMKSPEFDTQTLTVNGTVTSAGLVTIPIPSTGGTEVPCQVRYPDGFEEYKLTGATSTHTLSELWMAQYGRQIGADSAALKRLVTVDPLGNEYAPVYVTLTGNVSPDMVADEPEVDAASIDNVEQEAFTVASPETDTTPEAEPAPAPWATMTHAQIDQHMLDTNTEPPTGWGSMSLTQKRAWLDDQPAT